MKRNLLRIIAFAALLTGVLAGCQDDIQNSVVESEIRRGGRRIASEMTVLPTQDASRTKSSFVADPATVFDWCLFQFDADEGILVAKYYQNSAADISNISVVPDHGYNWYAVANVGNITGDYVVGSTTESAMTSLVLSGYDAETLAAAAGVPMSWKGPGLSFSSTEIKAGATLEVEMVRLVSKYDIIVNRAGLEQYVFSATGLTIEGASSVKPFVTGNRAASAMVAADRATASDVTALNAGGAATFYTLENMYGDLLSGNTDRWRKKPANIPSGSYPTYVEVAGNVRLAADVSAPFIPVTYRFYLGGDATKNFDVVRNTANTVTLMLSDDAVNAAIEEMENGDGGDPLWKIETGSYVDGRTLAFADESISLPIDGTPYREAIVKEPSDLPFVLKLDQTLIDAGVKVFTNSTMSNEVTPASGTSSSSLSGTVTELFFYYPSGGSPVSGTARIETHDGVKYDELTVSSGRALLRLDMVVGTYSTSSTYVPSSYDFTWADPSTNNAGRGTRYTAAAPMDTILANMTNRSAAPLRFAAQFYAVYSDGSEKLLKNGEYSVGNVTVTNKGSQTVNAVAAYNTPGAMFNLLEPLDGSHDKQAFSMEKTATATASVSYTEYATTVSIPMTVTVWRGAFDVTPHTRQTETGGIGRAVLNYGESLDVQYFYNAENGQSLNVSQQVSAVARPRGDGLNDNTLTEQYLSSYVYDDVNDKVVLTAISSASEPGPFKFRYNIANQSMNMRDIFGAKCRPAAIPSTVIDPSNTGITSYFSNVWITVQDPRVLDHIAFEPDYLYVGNTYNAVVASPAPDDAANSIWHYRLYAYYTNGTKQNISSLTAAQGLSWVDHGVSENLSSIWRFHTSYAPEAYDGYRVGWRFFDYNQGEDYLIVNRLESSGSGEGAYARALFAHFDESGVEEEGLSLYGITRLPQDLWTASYTFNGVTKSAAVRAIVLNDLVPVSLEVDPSSLTLHPYGTATVSVTVVYSDGTRIPASSAPGSFTVEGHYGSASMGGRYHGTAHNWGNDWASYCINEPSMTTGGVAVLAKGFTGSDSFSVKYVQGSTTLWADVDVSVVPEPASIYPVSLTITPKRRENVEGDSDISFVARASMSDGSTRNVSTVCDWSFENFTTAGSSYHWYASRHGQYDFAESNYVEIWGGGGGCHTDIVASYTLNGHTVSDRGYMSIKASAPVNHGSVTGVELQWKLHDWDSSQWSADAGTVGVGDDVDIRVCKVYADGYQESTTLVSSRLTTTGESLISWSGSYGDRFTATATGLVTFTYTDSSWGSDTLPITIQATSPWAGPVYWVVVEASKASGNTSTANGEISTNLAGGESVSYHAYYGERDGVGFKDNVFTDVTNACTWTLGSAISTHTTGSKTGGAYVVTSKGTNTTQLNDLLTVTYNGAHMVNSGAAYPIRITLLPAKYLTVDPAAVEWDYFEGAAVPKNIQVTSNVSWNVEWVSGGDKFTASKTSGNNNEIIPVSPAAAGTGAVANTGRLRVYNSEYNLEAFVDLTQYDWAHGPGGLEREIVELYIAPSGAEVNHGATQDYQVMVHWRERQNGGSWTDHNDPVYGHGSTGCSWSVSAGGTFSVASNGVGTLTNTNSGTSPVNATVTVTLGSSFSVYSPGVDVLQYALGQLVNAGVTLTTGVTLQPGGIVTTYKYKVVTTADPTAIQVAGEYNPAGSASVSALSAELFRQTYENGTLKKDWESQGSVTASGFTAVSGGSAVTISGATATAASAGTAKIRSSYNGQAIDEHEDATITVSAATPAPVITYGGFRIETAASQIECNGSTTVKAYLTRFVDGTPDTEIEVTGDTQFSVTSGGSYASVSGNTVTGTNTSSSDQQVTVSGVYSGSLVSGSVSATTGLTVKAKTVTDLYFDQSRYDLVEYNSSSRSFTYSKPYVLTVRYSDGSTDVVTSSADYSGTTDTRLNIDSSNGTFTALTHFGGSSVTVTANYGGLTATCECYAPDMRVPYEIYRVHTEAQGDKDELNFLIAEVKYKFIYAFQQPGNTTILIEDITDVVTVTTSSNIVFEGYQSGSGLRFHFTSAGTGWVEISHTENGVTVTTRGTLVMDSNGHMDDGTWS